MYLDMTLRDSTCMCRANK